MNIERIRAQEVTKQEEEEIANSVHHFDGDILSHEDDVEDENISNVEFERRRP